MIKPARRMTSASEPTAGDSGPSSVATTVYSVVSTRGNMAPNISVTAAVSSRALASANGTIVPKSHTRPTIINGQNLILTIAFITHRARQRPLSARRSRHAPPCCTCHIRQVRVSRVAQRIQSLPTHCGSYGRDDGDRQNCSASAQIGQVWSDSGRENFWLILTAEGAEMMEPLIRSGNRLRGQHPM